MVMPRWCHRGRGDEGISRNDLRRHCHAKFRSRIDSRLDGHSQWCPRRILQPEPTPSRARQAASFLQGSVRSQVLHRQLRGRSGDGIRRGTGAGTAGAAQVEPGVHVQTDGALGVHVRRSRHGRDEPSASTGRSEPTARLTALGHDPRTEPCPTRPARPRRHAAGSGRGRVFSMRWGGGEPPVRAAGQLPAALMDCPMVGGTTGPGWPGRWGRHGASAADDGLRTRPGVAGSRRRYSRRRGRPGRRVGRG